MKKSTHVKLINGDYFNDSVSPDGFKQKLKTASNNNISFIEVQEVNFYENKDGFQSSKGKSFNLMVSAIKAFS